MSDNYEADIREAQLIAIDSVRIQQERPSVIYKPRIGKDGNQWIAVYGDNIQEGVAGYGDSPEMAMADFDKAWNAKRSAKDGVRVSDDDVACAYQVADGYIDSKGGDVSKLDDGQWDEMLRLVLERYIHGVRA